MSKPEFSTLNASACIKQASHPGLAGRGSVLLSNVGRTL